MAGRSYKTIYANANIGNAPSISFNKLFNPPQIISLHP